MNQSEQESNTTPTRRHHRLKAFFSLVFGIVAVFLIMTSITVVWLNRTLIDNSTYVGTVTPMVTKPPIQNFIADKVSTQLISSAPIDGLAQAVLPASDLSKNLSSAQLKILVKPIIQSDIVGIIKSPSFYALWRDTNQSAQAEFIAQLKDNTNTELNLSLNPAINGIVDELKTSKLSAVADHISISPTIGNVDIKGNKVNKLRTYYNLFQLGTVAFVGATLIALVLSIWISVNHAKTLRRILLICGIFALLGAAILQAPQYISFKSHDLSTQQAIRSIVASVVHNLLMADLIIGVVLIVGVIGSTIYIRHKAKTNKPKPKAKLDIQVEEL
jgi:hypothetical protein